MTKVRMLSIAGLAFAAVVLVLTYLLLPERSNAIAPHDHAADSSPSVEMPDERVSSSGIELLKAGPGVLRDTLLVNGTIQPNQEALVQVTPRFSGILREMFKRVGDAVQKNELLARIESNQSLTVYDVRAALPGTIIDRQGTVGEYVSEQRPIFGIADLSTLWVDFTVRRQDLQRIRMGDAIAIDPGDGATVIQATISYISPIGDSATQTTLARAKIANDDLRLRPGMFVAGRVVLSEKPIDIAIPPSALQTIDGRTVVFVRNGQRFEPRQVETGARDHGLIEVLFGLFEGDVYAANNSLLIKAELSKRPPPHDH